MKWFRPVLWFFAVTVLLDVIGGANVDHKSQATKTRAKDKNRKFISKNQNSNRNRLAARLNSADNNAPTGNKEKRYLNSSEANKEIARLIKRNFSAVQDILKPKLKMNKTLRNKKLCHATATLRCGCEALKMFEEGNKTKCAIRERFFACLDEASKLQCRHPRKSIQKLFQKHIKEIARALWSTRVCLLHIDDDMLNSSFSNLKIKLDFCNKLSGKPKRNKMNKKKKALKNKS